MVSPSLRRRGDLVEGEMPAAVAGEARAGRSAAYRRLSASWNAPIRVLGDRRDIRPYLHRADNAIAQTQMHRDGRGECVNRIASTRSSSFHLHFGDCGSCVVIPETSGEPFNFATN